MGKGTSYVLPQICHVLWSDIDLRPILLIIYIDIQIWHKFVYMFEYQICYKFLHMPRQHNCHGMCKTCSRQCRQNKNSNFILFMIEKSLVRPSPVCVSLISPSCLSLSSQANTVSLQGCLSNHPGLCLHSSMGFLFCHMRGISHKTHFRINILSCSEATNETTIINTEYGLLHVHCWVIN